MNTERMAMKRLRSGGLLELAEAIEAQCPDLFFNATWLLLKQYLKAGRKEERK